MSMDDIAAKIRDVAGHNKAGEVKQSFLPDSFEWHDQTSLTSKKPKFSKSMMIKIIKTGIKISATAVQAAEINQDSKLQLGINKKFLAIRKGRTGFSCKLSKLDGSLTVISKAFVDSYLANRISKLSVDISCVYDKESNMLVAELPKEQPQDK